MTTTSRRTFLQQSLGSFGALAFAQLAHADQTPRNSAHFAPQAKSIIYLYMEGGPSQVDTFEFKPELQARDGQALPFEKPSTVFNSSNKLMQSPFQFKQYGETGSWVSELFPHLAECVDDLTFIHSMHHDTSNHSAACYLSHTGDAMAGRPSIGSWVTFGLGTENDELPGFIVLDCGQAPAGGSHCWSNGFLPSQYAGTKFLNGDVAVEFIDPLERNAQIQRRKLEALGRIRGDIDTASLPPDLIQSSIETYQKAAVMQTAVPELMSLDEESERTKRDYGLENPATETFGSRCLIARRLVERGVRFIEVFSPRVSADRWDQHGNLAQGHRLNCAAVDQPIAALINDLKSRGLLDETIVMWGGEFGRTPTSQGGSGRDHNPFGYTVFLAGGGFKPGVHHGATDDFGYYAMQDKVHLHDLHATLLHQFGIDHEQLTYRFGGRDYRLTDVFGRVVDEIIV